jgi:MSHA biogenesis protein MshM
VNILAHKSLMLTYGEGKQQVSARHVKAAANDTGAANKRIWPWAWFAAASLLIAGTGMGWAYLR